MSLNTNTAAPFDTCLQCDKEKGLKSLESIATIQKTIHCGSPCKMTSSFNGGLETEASGVIGYEDSKTSFYDGGWE